MSQPHTLIEDFTRYFRIELVTTEKQAREAYGVRYRVYCEEFKYEATDIYPDELEVDEFDEQSIHILIVHVATERTAGCVRIVPVRNSHENGLLPFEKFCKECLDIELIKSLKLLRSTECEISRLAVDGIFRRRSGEKATRFGKVSSIDCTQQEQRTFSLIAVAGLLAATAVTELTKKNNAFAMMEPFLPRLLKRSGILFEKVGEDMDYHGIRAPYFITTQRMLDNIRPDLKVLYGLIRRQIEIDFQRTGAENKFDLLAVDSK